MKVGEGGEAQRETLYLTLSDFQFWAISVFSHTQGPPWYQSYPSELLQNDVLWKTLEAEQSGRKLPCSHISS